MSSSLIDRVARSLGRRIAEVPVGFKWFVDGLLDGSYGFGGEESAGAIVPPSRRDACGRRTRTASCSTCSPPRSPRRRARIRASTTARSPQRLGEPFYARVDAPATPAQKAILKRLSPDDVSARELAGEPITRKLTHAPGERRAHRRHQGRDRRTAGSRRVHPAPRTSTRSTRRASSARRISRASRKKRRRSSPRRSRAPAPAEGRRVAKAGVDRRDDQRASRRSSTRYV